MPKLSLKRSLLLIGLLVGLVTYGQLFLTLNQEHSLKRDSEHLVNTDLQIIQLALELKLSVIQVQQWLSDISATRALDGLNDGFDEAEKYAKQFNQLRTRLQTLDPENSERYLAMQPNFDRYYSAGKQMAQAYIDQGPAGGNPLMSQFDEAAAAITEQVDTFVQETRQQVQQSGEKNLQSIETLNTILIGGAITLTIIMLLVVFLARHLLQSLGQDPTTLAAIANRIAKGDLSEQGELENGNPTGIYKALRIMRRNLRNQIEEINNQSEENGRIRTALDNVFSAVMVADNERNIIYLNRAAQTLFEQGEQDIRKELPNFKAANLLGSNIDQFHKNPRHQAVMLENLRSTHRSEIEIGGHSMSIIANPVTTKEGRRLGTAVEWRDQTAEKAVEHEVSSIVQAANNGDLTRRIDTDNKEGFFLHLGKDINTMLDRISNVFEALAKSLERLAEGDLDHPIRESFDGSYGKVSNDYNQTLEKLRGIFQNLRKVADDVNTSSREIVAGNDNLAQRTEKQVQNIDDAVTHIKQLTETTQRNADNAHTANQLASGAQQSASKGGEVVGDAIQAMERINTASNQIAEIIGVIDEIAFQTNLLALNASVEAARAGEQGRGFAVVATEVRNLAGRSASAAKEIKELIQDSVQKVNDGTRLVNASGETLQEIVDSVTRVRDIISEIAAASDEQASGINQVNMAMGGIDEMIKQNAVMAEEIHAASSSMSEKSNDIDQQLAFFNAQA